MKHICITYHMTRENMGAETCITLPMADDVARDILENEGRSEHLSMMQNGEVYRILKSLSAIQGYEYDRAYYFEEVNL